jgi:hypothetical protein
MSDKIKLELTPGQLRDLSRGHLAAKVERLAEATLAAHEREEKREALCAPWEAMPNHSEVGGRMFSVMCWETRANGKVQEALASELTESQARLMAAAPELAEDAATSRELLKEWLKLMFSSNMSAISGKTCTHIERITARLKKAGWDE